MSITISTMWATIKMFAWQSENYPGNITDVSTDGTNAVDKHMATCHIPCQEVHHALPAYAKQLHKMSVIMEYSDDIC